MRQPLRVSSKAFPFPFGGQQAIREVGLPLWGSQSWLQPPFRRLTSPHLLGPPYLNQVTLTRCAIA
jgi:hypothetical protein